MEFELVGIEIRRLNRFVLYVVTPRPITPLLMPPGSNEGSEAAMTAEEMNTEVAKM